MEIGNNTTLPVKESVSLQPKTAPETSQTRASSPLEKETAHANEVERAKQQPDDKKLNDAVEKANKLVQSFNRYLNFSVDKSTDTLVVKVVDGKTKEVVRQIPPKEMLTLIERFDKLQALLFSKEV